MSETFYIKNTAFDGNSADLVQREANSFIIPPGELNGPGGDERHSDLELYGFGALKWGEGVNQNQYRQMENNACPAKETGDFLPGTDVGDSFVAGTGSYTVGVDAILPKDRWDLGIGNGITNPLIGQLWYNTTDLNLYNFELVGSPVSDAGWKTVYDEVVVEASAALDAHATDDTLHLDVNRNQNAFLDALNLPTLTASEVNTLIGIDGGTVQGQLHLMVEKAGDDMTGPLLIDMAASATPGLTIEANLSPTITLKSTTTGGSQRISYIDANNITRAETSANENTGEYYVTINSDAGGQQAQLILETDGNLSLIGGANVPTEIDHLTRLDYVNTKAPIDSPTLTGVPTAPTPATSDDSTTIATTEYVKNQDFTNIGTIFKATTDGNTIVPDNITSMKVKIIGAGGGGASNLIIISDGEDGEPSTLTTQTETITVGGGLGGRYTWAQHTSVTVEDLQRVNDGGLGVSNPGDWSFWEDLPGTVPHQGGHGGVSPLGQAGLGDLATDTVTYGGGAAGDTNPLDAGGATEGGASGHYWSGVLEVLPGDVISWTIGEGGPGGAFLLSGGDGLLIVEWLQAY